VSPLSHLPMTHSLRPIRLYQCCCPHLDVLPSKQFPPGGLTVTPSKIGC
jgi:hypothetical protein